MSFLHTSKPVIRNLYRSLLKQAKVFDQTPAMKAFWMRPSELKLEPYKNQIYYVPRSESFVAEVRRHFRYALLPSTPATFNQKIDLAFSALRSMNSNYSRFIEHLHRIEQDYPNHHYDQQAFIPSSHPIENQKLSKDLFEALTPNLWAVAEPNPVIRPGLFLVAHPMESGFMQHAVILIVSHSEKATYGLILNKKSNPFAMDGRNRKKRGKRNFSKDFSISTGGPHQTQRLLLVHTQEEQSNSVPIFGNLFMNDLSRENSNLAKDKPLNARAFAGFKFWTPFSLKKEIDQGIWIPAAASEDFVFQSPTGSVMWGNILRCLGGEYTSFVEVPQYFWGYARQESEAIEEDIFEDYEAEAD